MSPRCGRRRSWSSRRSRRIETISRRTTRVPTASSRSRSTPTSSSLSSNGSLLQATDRGERVSPRIVERLGRRLSLGSLSLPLLSRVLIGSVGLSVLVAAAFALALLAMPDLRSSTNAQAHSKDVSTATLELERVVNELESSLRGYVSGSGRGYLASWQQGRRSLPAAVTRVERLVASQPAQSQQAGQLATDTHAYVTEYGLPLLEIFRKAPNVARSDEATREGLFRISTIRQELAGLLASEDNLTSARSASAKREAARAVSVGIAALFLAAALLLAFAVFLAHGVVRPVRLVPRRGVPRRRASRVRTHRAEGRALRSRAAAPGRGARDRRRGAEAPVRRLGRRPPAPRPRRPRPPRAGLREPARQCRQVLAGG